jgi:predicted nucleic acid-binding protein
MDLIMLDSNVLGLVSNPNPLDEARRCAQWLNNLLISGATVILPEIADYEIRRELLRAGKVNGLRRLDLLKAQLNYLPITTEMMLQAAEFWAQARRRGKPTAGAQALDADAILAAQAHVASANANRSVVIATKNVRHFTEVARANSWENIAPA